MSTLTPEILKTGQVVGNYVVEGQIGQGGMGAVYRARHPRIGRVVAIKVLFEEGRADPNTLARFQNEARAANEIKNEHIIDVLDFGTLPDGAPYFIMEWLEGKSLGDALDIRPRFGLDRAMHVFRGIAVALAAAHEHGIVHRDLKPENIYLIERTGDPDFVKVLDFGIAKLIGNREGMPSATTTGSIFGTPLYMSPEQCKGTSSRIIDHRTDIYSLGLILYRMVTGAFPFDPSQLGVGEILVAHITAPAIPPRQYVPELPEWMERVILRALEKDPARRFASVAEMRDEAEREHAAWVQVRGPAASQTGKRPAEAFAATMAHPSYRPGDSAAPGRPVAAVASTPPPAALPVGTTPHPAALETGPVTTGELVSRMTLQAVGPPGAAAAAATAINSGGRRPVALILAALAGVGAIAVLVVVLVLPSTRPPDPAPPVKRSPAAKRVAPRSASRAAVARAVDAAGAGAVAAAADAGAPAAATPAVAVPPRAADAGSTAGQVSVRIETEPPGATLTLDGARLPNPFQGRFAKSDLSRQLKATLAGHEDWAEWVIFDQDRVLSPRLKARAEATAAVVDAGPAPAIGPPPVRPRGRPLLRLRASAPAPAAPAAAAAARPARPAPAAVPPKPKKAVPQVDETYPPP